MTNLLANTAAGAGTGAGAGAAFGPYGALIGAVAGGTSSAYGSYLKSQQADLDYQRAIQAWKEDQERIAQMEAQRQQQQGLQNNLTAGQYTQGVTQNAGAQYADYAKRLGL